MFSLPGRAIPLTPQNQAEAAALDQFGITIERRQKVIVTVRDEALTREMFAAKDDDDVIKLTFRCGLSRRVRSRRQPDRDVRRMGANLAGVRLLRARSSSITSPTSTTSAHANGCWRG